MTHKVVLSILSVFAVTFVFYIYTLILQTSANWDAAIVTGESKYVKDGHYMEVQWTTEPVPNCDVTIAQYVEDPEGYWHLSDTLFHTGEGHQNFVNKWKKPDEHLITFPGTDYLLPEVGPGVYKLHLHFAYKCGPLGYIFPQYFKIKPVTVEAPNG